MPDAIRITPATPGDVPVILSFIRELAEYEKLLDRVTATEQLLCHTLFGPRPYAEVLIARLGERPVGLRLLGLRSPVGFVELEASAEVQASL